MGVSLSRSTAVPRTDSWKDHEAHYYWAIEKAHQDGDPMVVEVVQHGGSAAVYEPGSDVTYDLDDFLWGPEAERPEGWP